MLEAHGVAAAHLVGVSAGGAFAQLLALGFPERALSLVLISTSPALPVAAELPQPTEQFVRFVQTAEVDWTDAGSVIEYPVEYQRVLAGTGAAVRQGGGAPAWRLAARADPGRPAITACTRGATGASGFSAERQFRKIIGYRDLATLVIAIERDHDRRRGAHTATKEAAIVLTA